MLKNGDIFLFENVCFYVEEEVNDFVFAVKLVENIDVYINDVFGVVYWVYVLIVGIVKVVSEKGGFCVVGLLMEREF